MVRVAELWQPVRAIRHNLPAERDAFVGRTRELHALAQRLDRASRLRDRAGPGGAGKTRFVRRYASAWLGDWPGGVYFCDLSEARSLQGHRQARWRWRSTFPSRRTMPSPRSGTRSPDAAAAWSCSTISSTWCSTRSRRSAAGLSAPPTRYSSSPAASGCASPARRAFRSSRSTWTARPIDLFVARARAQRPDFALTAANRDDVGRIVRLLDGLPLAIELAAARVRVLSPAQLVAAHARPLRVLAGARGDVARQATLRAAIDWSWDLLAPWEQAALAQCAVFEGGFTLELAEPVIDLAAWPTRRRR